MPNHPNRSPAHKSRTQKFHKVTLEPPTQHGTSHILSIPPESTAYITAYLDPLSLAALSRVNHHFHDHVKQDNTWLKAFNWHCFQITPESNVPPHQQILLRRNDASWRDEFVNRFNMTR
jgi:hypothetical protein